jgi:Dephospho-CoA kinase
MFILGLTGGIATGKTTATDFFASKGIEIIDADEISRSLQLKGARWLQTGVTRVWKRYSG